MSRRVTASVWITLASLALTVVIWAVRLEGRVDHVQDKQQDLDRKVYDELRFIREELRDLHNLTAPR